eukprot:9067728-Alexandrium_andersonii.AAC.1
MCGESLNYRMATPTRSSRVEWFSRGKMFGAQTMAVQYIRTCHRVQPPWRRRRPQTLLPWCQEVLACNLVPHRRALRPSCLDSRL